MTTKIPGTGIVESNSNNTDGKVKIIKTKIKTKKNTKTNNKNYIYITGLHLV